MYLCHMYFMAALKDVHMYFITLTPLEIPLRLQLRFACACENNTLDIQTQFIPLPRHTTPPRALSFSRRINPHINNPTQLCAPQQSARPQSNMPDVRIQPHRATTRPRAILIILLTSASRSSEPSSSSPSSASCTPSPSLPFYHPERTTNTFPAMTHPKPRASLCAGGPSASTFSAPKAKTYPHHVSRKRPTFSTTPSDPSACARPSAARPSPSTRKDGESSTCRSSSRPLARRSRASKLLRTT